MIYPENASVPANAARIRGLEYAVKDDGRLRLTTFLIYFRPRSHSITPPLMRSNSEAG